MNAEIWLSNFVFLLVGYVLIRLYFKPRRVRPFPQVYGWGPNFTGMRDKGNGTQEITCKGSWDYDSPGKGDIIHDGSKRYEVLGIAGMWAGAEGHTFSLTVKRADRDAPR